MVSLGTGDGEWRCDYDKHAVSEISEKQSARADDKASPFWGDMFVNLPELLPREQRPGPSWYP